MVLLYKDTNGILLKIHFVKKKTSFVGEELAIENSRNSQYIPPLGSVWIQYPCHNSQHYKHHRHDDEMITMMVSIWVGGVCARWDKIVPSVTWSLPDTDKHLLMITMMMKFWAFY